MFRNRHRASQRRGTTTVEMAVVAPVIFILIFGQIEFARLMMIRQAATNAARESCRHACLITTQDSADSISVGRSVLDGVVGKSRSELVEIAIKPAFSSGAQQGDRISSQVEVDFDEVSWLPPFFTKGTKIRASMEMIRE